MIIYQNFNDSCSYIGVANLLLDYDVVTTDYEIALGIGSPYILKYEENEKTYYTGTYIQSARYFNNYLKQYNLKMVEEKMYKIDVPNFLESSNVKLMIGMKQPYGGGHAYIYIGLEEGKFKFLNTRLYYSTKSSEDYIFLNRSELLSRLKDEVTIGRLEKGRGEEINLKEEITISISTLNRYRACIEKYCSDEKTPEELEDSMDKLFRPIFLQLVDMMHYIGEEKLCEKIKKVRSDYLTAIRLKRKVALKDHLSLEELISIIDDYEKILIRKCAEF